MINLILNRSHAPSSGWQAFDVSPKQMQLYDSHESAIVEVPPDEFRAYCEADNEFPNSLDLYRYTPLIWACSLQAAEHVKILLENGANPSFEAPDGDTPLKAAIPRPGDRWDREIYRRLFDYGANPNLGCFPPLHLAIWFGHRELVEYLLDRGADPNLADADGETPLNATERSRTDGEQIKRALIRAGAKPRPWEKQ